MISPILSWQGLLLALREFGRKITEYLRSHLVGTVVTTCVSVSVIALMMSWRFVRLLPLKLSKLAIAILGVAKTYPFLGRIIHVLIGSVPDVVTALLTLAGLSYLMPDLAAKLEKKKMIRVGIFMVFATFTVAGIIVNAINREEQENKNSHQEAREDAIEGSIGNVLTFLHDSKGALNEAERRRKVLQALRDKYVISHPDVPVTMITGDAYPPDIWMNDQLRQLGESWRYVPPAHDASPTTIPAVPPSVEVLTIVADEKAGHPTFASKPNASWFEFERNCTKKMLGGTRFIRQTD